MNDQSARVRVGVDCAWVEISDGNVCAKRLPLREAPSIALYELAKGLRLISMLGKSDHADFGMGEV